MPTTPQKPVFFDGRQLRRVSPTNPIDTDILEQDVVITTGERPFTGNVGGVNATADSHLTTRVSADRRVEDGFWAAPVQNILNNPPVAPLPEQRWLVGPLPTGAWEGHAHAYASWRDVAWFFVPAVLGTISFNKATGAYLHFNGSGWSGIIGVGTVTSVGLALPPEFSVTGSPVTGVGELTAAWAPQIPGRVFAGPAAPVADPAAPAFRSLVVADIPILPITKISSRSSLLSSGGTSIPVVTIDTTGLLNVSSISANLNPNADFSGDTTSFVIPALTNYQLSANTYYYLTVFYNAGTPVYEVITDNTLINHANRIAVCNLFWENTGPINEGHVFCVGAYGYGLSNKIAHRLIHTERFGWQDGLSLSDPGSRQIEVSAGTVWYDGSEIPLGVVSSGTTSYHLYYHVSPGVWTAAVRTQYSNSEYDNGTGLQTVGDNHYSVSWVYRSVSDSGLFVVLGTAPYTLAQAQAAQPPASLPAVISKQGIFVGRIIVMKSSETATQIDSAFAMAFSSSGITNHNDTTGIQGGILGEAYHLSSAAYGALTGLQAANTVYAAPSSGEGTPTFRSLVLADLPTSVVSGNGVTGQVSYWEGANVQAGSTLLTYNSTLASGGLAIANTTSSTSSTTGALKVAGGVGISGALNVQGPIWSYASISLTGYSNSKYILIDGGGNDYWGTILVRGGSSVNKFDLILASVGGTPSPGPLPASLFGYHTKSASSIILSSTSSYSPDRLLFGIYNTDRPIIIGINTSEVAQFTGGNLGTGALQIKYTTNSISPATGALQVAGGVGVGGSVTVNGDVGIGGFLKNSTQSVTTTSVITASRVRFTGSTVGQVLPLPAAVNGRDVWIRNSGTVDITVSCAGADTIEGSTANFTISPGEAFSFTAIGTDWTTF